MRKLTTGAVVLAAVLLGLLATQVAMADRTYTMCDSARTSLCSGLIAVYEFDETSTTGGVARTSETGSSRLIDMKGKTRHTAVTASGKLGYALDHQAYAYDGLFISRTAPFAGTWTMTFWIYINTPPSGSGKHVPILWTCPIQASTDFYCGAYTPETGGTQPPWISLVYGGAANTSKVEYNVRQTMLNTDVPVTSSALNNSTWYWIALGQYPTPDYTHPTQQTLWISVNNGARTTATTTWPDYGRIGHLMVAGLPTTSTNWEYGAYRLDQMAMWGRYLTDAELTTVYNSGTGKAYPFY